jgi:NADPH2:quinone reductase
MTIAIRISQAGGPDVLKVVSIMEAPPGPGEVWIEQEAIGVNFLDLTQRKWLGAASASERFGF